MEIPADSNGIVKLLIDIQEEKGFSDQEFAQVLQLKTRQQWYFLKTGKRGKRGIPLVMLCAVCREFPQLIPEILVWMRHFSG